MNDQEAILAQRYAWKDAVEACDVDAVMSYYVAGEDYVAFDIMPPIQFAGTDAFRENWVRFFALFDGVPRFGFRDLRVTADAELAFVSGFTHFEGKLGDREMDTWCRETNCLRKVDGVWLLAHDHISFPVDLDTGRGCLDLVPPNA